MTAAEKGCDKCLELLIQAGADVNQQNGKGDTALIRAAQNGHDKSVDMLIKSGANMNRQNHCGSTALIETDIFMQV